MNAIKSFFDKYNAVLVKPGHTRPDYTCKLSTLARLTEIADQLAASYKTADAEGREHIARDLSDIEFEVQVRWVVVLNAGNWCKETCLAFVHFGSIRLDTGADLPNRTDEARAEAARRTH